MAPSDCMGIVEYIGDGYCDDVNNNIECQLDGGDCCPPNMDDWDVFCEVSCYIQFIRLT